MSQRSDYDRRRFLETTAFSVAAAHLGLLRSADAHAGSGQERKVTASSGGTSSFGALKSIDAGLLNVAYAEAGPPSGPAVILLHGWPYDIHSFEDVAPVLATNGYRVIVPYLRGYGSTRFLSPEAFRNGQPSAVALDTLDLMDALRIDRAVLAGFDWGARTADIIAVLRPERCKAIVSVSGYLIGSPEAGKAPLPPAAELQWWYQFYFATDRGRAGYDKNRHDFAKLIWQLASPKWRFDDATFDRSAASFANPDHVAIVVHNYRWRLGLAEGERKYDELLLGVVDSNNRPGEQRSANYDLDSAVAKRQVIHRNAEGRDVPKGECSNPNVGDLSDTGLRVLGYAKHSRLRKRCGRVPYGARRISDKYLRGGVEPGPHLAFGYGHSKRDLPEVHRHWDSNDAGTRFELGLRLQIWADGLS